MEAREFNLIPKAVEQLDKLCAKVDLRRVNEVPSLKNSVKPPDGTTLWSSTYARVVLWPCSASDSASFENAAATGQAWFDEVLVHDERETRGRPIDGYLVLALPETPNSNAREDIRRIELSAQVCRKHLIWPSAEEEFARENARWERIDDVTVLGLPDGADAPTAELQWPDLDAEADSLWRELDAIGVSEAILRHGGTA